MRSVDRVVKSMDALPPLTSRKGSESKFAINHDISEDPHHPHYCGRYDYGSHGKFFLCENTDSTRFWLN